MNGVILFIRCTPCISAFYSKHTFLSIINTFLIILNALSISSYSLYYLKCQDCKEKVCVINVDKDSHILGPETLDHEKSL